MTSEVTLVSVDREGNVTLWSAEAQELFGFTPGEVLGNSVELIIPKNFRARHWAGFRQFVQTGVSHLPDEISATTGVTKNGAHIRLAISVEAIRDNSSQIIGVAAKMKMAGQTNTSADRGCI